jgi:peptidoglycan hydrolase CwlO-like protein
MKNETNEQLPGRAVRKLITAIAAIVITGWMIFTGYSYLTQPDARIKQFTVLPSLPQPEVHKQTTGSPPKNTACFDQGRSGYWCPDASSTMAANISEERAAAKNDLLRLQGERERVEAEIAEQSKDRDRLSKELSAVKQQITDLEVQLEQSKHN